VSRSTRYTFILVVVSIGAALAALSGWKFAKASAPVNGPIILISIDSLRADHLPAYGYSTGRTPAIDALAADGVVFEHAYSHVPETLPAHAALLTGRLPFETGVRDVAGVRLPESVRTIGELLHDRGYATGGIVSSFLLRRDTGIARGFTFFDAELPPADDRHPLGGLMRDGAESEQVAEHWLDSIGTSRAFLFLHLAAPRNAPERFSQLGPYDADIAYADECIGRLLRYLKAHQLYDRSTILLVADHGEGLGDHGEQTHGLLVYEEALRIPLVIKEPGGDGAQRRVGAPVQLIDIVPTILDLARAPGASGLRGRSLTPLLAGGTLPQTSIYAESMYGAYRFGWAPLATLIEGRYQLITSGTQTELYDLEAPKDSRRDLANEQTATAATLHAHLDGIGAKDDGAKPMPVTASDQDRFEALGYVGVLGAAPVKDGDEPGIPTDPVRFVEQYRAAALLSRTSDARDALEAWRALATQQPEMADIWMHLGRTAARGERHDVAVDAYRHAVELDPDSIAARLGVASSSLRIRKLDDATEQAQHVIDSGVADSVQTAEAHELLARAALARRDPDAARAEAALAEDSDAQRPVRAFVEGRIALQQARYADAAESFDQALAAARSGVRAPLADLRVYAADAFAHVDRGTEAEQLLVDELATFPANARARTALQTLYRSAGRVADAAALAQHQ
jgi:tetratricopeptide (TPR) repeat protein